MCFKVFLILCVVIAILPGNFSVPVETPGKLLLEAVSNEGKWNNVLILLFHAFSSISLRLIIILSQFFKLFI